MIAIELRTDEECKSPFHAYIFWFFLGWLGAHRFYVGHGK
ncbi:NINE protein, partial [Aquidulcibacter sp.]